MAEISDNTSVAMPIRNMVSIIVAVAVATWAYFGIIERLNKVEVDITLMSDDVEKNTEFRIKWPRGEMGTLPADSEQFMLLEHMATQVEKILKDLGEMMHNKVNITRLQKDVEKLGQDVEKLKDGQRGLLNGGSSHK